MRMDSVVLRRDGTVHPVTLVWGSCVAAGYTGRDQAAVQAHVDELRAIGVPAPSKVPTMYWIEPERVSSRPLLHVVGTETSGEGELFFARGDDGNLYVTVASEHTDRGLETISVAKAKQVCSKVVAPACWRVDEIRHHWDSIELKVWIDGTLYQSGTLGQMLPPERIFEFAVEDSPEPGSSVALFSGTLPIICGAFVYGSCYELSLYDGALNRELRLVYRVSVLPDRN